MGRASILDSLDDDEADLDLSRFQPKAGPDKDALPAEQVRAIAEASNFPSREPKPRRAPAAPVAAPAPETPPNAAMVRRPPRRHRTGGTMQLNARTTPRPWKPITPSPTRRAGWSGRRSSARLRPCSENWPPRPNRDPTRRQL